MKNKYASLNLTLKSVDPALFQIRAVFSTNDEDRHGEVVDQRGWKLTEFLLNPVVLWAHDDYQPAIGKVIDIGFVEGNLEGTIQFAAAEYDFAKTIYNLYAGGYVRAISVGFMNDKWMFDEANQRVILMENTLYEVSCVNIPANALALAKSKGMDVSSLEKRADRTKLFNENMLHKTEAEKEVVPPVEKEEVKEPVAPVVEPVKVDEPAPVVEPVKDAAMDAAKALEVLCAADNGTIQAAVKVLNRLDVAKTSQHGSSVDGKKTYSVTQINRVMRHLQKGKSKNNVQA